MSSSSRRALTGEADFVLVARKGGGNSRISSSSSSSCRCSLLVFEYVVSGGGNEASLCLPFVSESDEKYGLALREVVALSGTVFAASLLADGLLRFAAARSLFASSLSIAAALLNPPILADRFELLDARERILFVRSVPAPRAWVEGPAMNSISLLLVSNGNLDVDPLLLLLHAILLAVVLVVVDVVIVGREIDDR